MIKKNFLILIFLISGTICLAQEDFFKEAKQKFNNKKYEDSKFLFQRQIVFNPKDAKSYLYLAKIFNVEDNVSEEEKNLDTVLLLDPSNEDAIYMMIKIKLKKSNFSKSKELLEVFSTVCKNLCNKKKEIKNTLKDIEPKNES